MTVLERPATAPRTIATRPLRPGDDTRIAELFEATVALGHPAPAGLVGFEIYRRMCLGWYLERGRDDAAVAVAPTGAIAGYAFVCANEQDQTRFARESVGELVGTIGRAALRGRLDRTSRRFYQGRLRDLAGLLRSRREPVAAVHAHLNVSGGHRRGDVALALVAHIDEVCRAAGEPAWYGEVNEKVGRRSRALQRLGFDVLDRVPNHTLTALVGQPVERLTILRRLDAD